MGTTQNLWDRHTVSAAALATTKKIEGFSAVPYDDNGGSPGGTWTQGYGSIRDEDGNPITPQSPAIDEVTASQWIANEMAHTASYVDAIVSVPLVDYEAAALLSWTYNLGPQNLRTSTMRRCILAGNRTAVPSEMRKWVMDEGKPSLGLLRRRWAEAAIFQGIDPQDAVTRAWREINSLGDWPVFTQAAPLA